MSEHRREFALLTRRRAGGRMGLPSFWVVAVGLLLAAAGVSRCDCAGNPGGACQCETDDDCPDTFHCDGCYCDPDCISNEDCPETMPNCGPDGICFAACTENADCPPELPNCQMDGICMALCEVHEDCTHPDLPNCQMDANMPLHGMCTEPCVDASDCESALYPNCDPTPGRCIEPCTDDNDCPEELRICDTDTGLCFDPECETDSPDCDPPNTVCEDWHCVPGCTTHADCAPEDRCDLITPGHLNHCEPRDCFFDDPDCNPPTTVCDTDGLADPDGGGYCLPGCTSFYDCPIGYDCETPDGTCLEHDYGDIGDPCTLGCDSQFCLAGMGNVCTAFCCVQHDCPPDWGCRPYDDGTGGGHVVDVCVPLDATQGDGRYGDDCTDNSDCRSDDCYYDSCLESCCTAEDCDHVPGAHCMPATGRTMCRDPGTGLDPLGTPGCGTSGGAGDCLSNLCYSFLIYDTGCTTDSDCTNPAYPTCYLYIGGSSSNDPLVTDCVRDQCVDHCCNVQDCPDYVTGEQFYCAKVTYNFADINICLRYQIPGAGQEGAPCTTGSQCRSRYCGAGDVCRARCCTDVDCTDPAYPTCLLEQHWSAGPTRWVNVCM